MRAVTVDANYGVALGFQGVDRRLHGSDPSGRVVDYAETGQTGVAEITPSWSPRGRPIARRRDCEAAT